MLGNAYVMALVCHCEAVTERAIRRAIRHGACSVDDVVDLCGAGGRCGGCLPVVEEMLETHVSVSGGLSPRLVS